MKLWFIEPRPNVFVSGVKDSVAEGIVKYLFESCSPNAGLLILQRINQPPYYRIWSVGNSQKKIAKLDGLQLIFEKIGMDENATDGVL